MSELKKGDVVVLKSGGPKMTIEGIGNYGMTEKYGALCIWFDKTKKYEEVFDLDTLEPYKPSPIGVTVVRG